MLKKIIIVICGIFFSIVLLEVGLRLFGFASSYIKEYRDRTSAYRKGVYRIMCLGESTTSGQYPRFLENILNQRKIGIKFSVIDKGIAGANTHAILSELEGNLNKFQPDMVVTMMGFNDRYMMYYKDIPESNTELFQHCRVYRFARLIYMHLLNKLNKKDIFSLDRAVKNKKTRIKKVGSVENGNLLLGKGSPEVKEKSLDHKNETEAVDPERFYRAQGNISQENYYCNKTSGSGLKTDGEYIELGDLYWQQGKLIEASDAFSQAVRAESKSNLGYCKFGEISLILGRFSEAEESFKKAIEICPGDDQSYAGLGVFYQLQGRLTESEASFRYALHLNPNNHRAYLGLGEVCCSLNKLLEAKQLIKKTMELNPALYELYTGLGIRMGQFYVFQGSKLAEEAEVLFKKAIEANPKSEWLYIELGDIYRSQGKLSVAEFFFKEALKLNPNNDNTYIVLGELYRSQGKLLPEAEALFKKASELNPGNDWAYIVLGNFFRINCQGKLPEAEALFKKALEINPKNDQAYLALGELYTIKGNLVEAESLFKKALEINPKNDWVCRALESLYMEMNKTELIEKYENKSVGLSSKEYSYSQVAVNNYHKLKEALDKRGIRLVCAQYAMRSVQSLKKVFDNESGVIFVDNEKVFKEAVKHDGYREYFVDMFGGDFGHCTDKGNKLLAKSISDVILKEVFNK